MTLYDIQRKFLRLPNVLMQRIRRMPARLMEKVSDIAYFIRTGKVKMQEDILRYADETGVVSNIHPADLIFQFVEGVNSFV